MYKCFETENNTQSWGFFKPRNLAEFIYKMDTVISAFHFPERREDRRDNRHKGV